MAPKTGGASRRATSMKTKTGLIPLLTLDVPPSFSLRNAICSYGFYMAAPNKWVEEPPVPDHYEMGAFARPLLLAPPQQKDGGGRHILETALTRPSDNQPRQEEEEEVKASHLLAALCSLSDPQSLRSVVVKLRQQWKRPKVDVLVEEGMAASMDELDKMVVMAQVRRMLRLQGREDRARRAFEDLWCREHCEGSGNTGRGSLEQDFADEAMGVAEASPQESRKRRRGACATHADVEIGRLFRSPTIWEDCVKTITLCNSSWPRTLAMNAKLCEAFSGNFPMPCQLGLLDPVELQSLGSVALAPLTTTLCSGKGYRAERIIQLAQSFLNQPPASSPPTISGPAPPTMVTPTTDPSTNGHGKARKQPRASKPSTTALPSLSQLVTPSPTSTRPPSPTVDVRWLESPDRSEAEVYSTVLSWPGFGPYSASTICQLLGHYGRIPSDTETVRHLLEHHGIKELVPSAADSSGSSGRRGGNGSPNKAKLEVALESLYGKYGNVRFLAYWTELWGCYIAKVGVKHMGELEEEAFTTFTASTMAKMPDAGTPNTSRGRSRGRETEKLLFE